MSQNDATCVQEPLSSTNGRVDAVEARSRHELSNGAQSSRLGRSRAGIDRIAFSLLALLRTEAHPMPEATIFRLVGGRRQYKIHALRSLVSEGKLLRLGSGTRGDPYLYGLKGAQPMGASRERTSTQVNEVSQVQGISIAQDGSQARTSENKQEITSRLESVAPISGPEAPQAPIAATRPYTEYRYPNGETIQLTKEEFDNVVDLFRLLLRQDQRNQAAKNAPKPPCPDTPAAGLVDGEPNR